METIVGGRRASKDKKLPSSAHVVLSNDDLLIEILLRSPVISIIRCKSVSKRRLSLITSPTFALFRSQIPNLNPPSGLFLRRCLPPFEYDFVPLDISIPEVKYPPKFNFTSGSAAGNVEILQSCNGLLLCCMETDHRDKMIYVCNPSLNRFKMLPKQNYYDLKIRYVVGIKMAFDPTKSPHYKVIQAAAIESEDCFIQLQIYSSEIGNWSINGVPFALKYFMDFSDGIYWNDAIFCLCGQEVTYLKLNVQHPLLKIIEIPTTGIPRYTYKLFESRGCLLLVCKDFDPYISFNVYEMNNEYCEWLPKYRVYLNDIEAKMSTELLYFCVRFIVLGEREDESFFVMEMNGKIFKYNIVLKTLSVLSDLGVTRIHGIPIRSRFNGLPFIASFAGV